MIKSVNKSGFKSVKKTERHPGIHGGIKSFRTRHKKRYTNFLKALHEVLKSVTKTITLSAGQLRPQDSEARLVKNRRAFLLCSVDVRVKAGNARIFGRTYGHRAPMRRCGRVAATKTGFRRHAKSECGIGVRWPPSFFPPAYPSGD